MTTKTESTAYLLGQTPDWSSETRVAIGRVVSLAEELEEQAASNAERTVNETTRHDLWNALVDLRASVSSQESQPND